MEESSRSSMDTTHTTNITKEEMENQQKYLAWIDRNNKDLEIFMNNNFKIKSCLNELVNSYLTNNEEKMTLNYKLLRDNLKSIEHNTSTLNKNLALTSNFNNCITNLEYQNIFNLKNYEVNEFLVKSEYALKQNLTISTFKNLIDDEKDELLRDILREDYLSYFKKNYLEILKNYKQQQTPNEKTNEIPNDLIADLNKKFLGKLTIIKQEKEGYQYQLININITNSFVIHLRVSREIQNSFDLNICNYNEYSKNSITNFLERRERKFLNLMKKNKVDDISDFKLMRKLSSFLDEKFNIILRYFKPPFKIGFYNFIHFISTYTDLFLKKCNFCKVTAKLNQEEKSFYPPIYKIIDFEADSNFHYHEECYNYINNSYI